LREDLLIEVRKLAKERRFDYLLIESTGISEPMQVAETFTFEDEKGNSLSNHAQLGKKVFKRALVLIMDIKIPW
jgi:G3E family GTPase